jgi:hypothetical protein
LLPPLEPSRLLKKLATVAIFGSVSWGSAPTLGSFSANEVA